MNNDLIIAYFTLRMSCFQQISSQEQLKMRIIIFIKINSKVKIQRQIIAVIMKLKFK
jgi:hypothetical protein